MLLISGNNDESVRIWDGVTLQSTVLDHPARVNTVAMVRCTDGRQFGHASPESIRDDAAKVRIQPVGLQLSADKQARWWRSTDTGQPRRGRHRHAGRPRRSGDRRNRRPVKDTTTPGGIRNVAFAAASPMRPPGDAGMASDHFWIIVSYADVTSGAIWATCSPVGTGLGVGPHDHRLSGSPSTGGRRESRAAGGNAESI
jgi:hypothetical protein